jgi:Mitochondrial biogenesis AIM24
MESNATCPWCRLPLPPQATTCPHCGAPVDVRGQVSDSGWHELPPIRDLARIQFGRSDVQVAGTYVPVADCNLAPGEGVYFTHHVLLWRDPTVQVQAMPVGGWKRMFAGLPVIMTQAQGPGHIAFSRDAPG